MASSSSKDEDGSYGHGSKASSWQQPEWKNVSSTNKDLILSGSNKSDHGRSSPGMALQGEHQQQSTMGLNLGLGSHKRAAPSPNDTTLNIIKPLNTSTINSSANNTNMTNINNSNTSGNNNGNNINTNTSPGAKGNCAKKGRASPQGVTPRCQVEGCTADLSGSKDYHRRHKVCEVHSKTPKNTVHGQDQRFCQQCSRFHLLAEFDEGKRSCRRRLAGHNERRRKPQPDALAAYSMGNLQDAGHRLAAAYQRLGPSIIVDGHAYSRGSWGQLGQQQVIGKQLVDNLSAEKLLLLLQSNNSSRRSSSGSSTEMIAAAAAAAATASDSSKKDQGLLTLSSAPSGANNNNSSSSIDSSSRALSLLSPEPSNMSSVATTTASPYEHHRLRHQEYHHSNNSSSSNNDNKFLVRSTSGAHDAIPLATASGKVYHSAIDLSRKVTGYEPQQMP